MSKQERFHIPHGGYPDELTYLRSANLGIPFPVERWVQSARQYLHMDSSNVSSHQIVELLTSNGYHVTYEEVRNIVDRS